MQSNWLIAGPCNTIRITFFNFCRKSSNFQVSIVLALEIVKIRFLDTSIQDINNSVTIEPLTIQCVGLTTKSCLIEK